MTVSTTAAYSGPYAGNGATVEFPFTFKAMSTAEVEVRVNGVAQVAGFTVTLADPGGTVTFTIAPETGDEVLIVSDPDFRQDIAFTSNGAFLAETNDTVNDRAAVRDIKLLDEVSRALRVPIGESLDVISDADTRAGTVIGFWDDGTLRYFDPDGFGGGAAGPPGTAESSSGVDVVPTALDGSGNASQILFKAEGAAGQVNGAGGDDGFRVAISRSTQRFTNGPVGHVTYWDNVVGLGHNITATFTRDDATQPASMIKLESKFYQSGAFVSEPIIAIIDNGGTERRLLYSLMPHNFVDRAISLFQPSADRYSWTDWGGVEMIRLFKSELSLNFAASFKAVFNTNNLAVLQQINAAGNAYLQLPYINASDQLIIDQQIVSPHGADFTDSVNISGAAASNVGFTATNTTESVFFVSKDSATNAPAFGTISNHGHRWKTNNTDRLEVTAAGILKFLTMPGDYADDVAAAAASVPVGGVYRTGSALKVRVA